MKVLFVGPSLPDAAAMVGAGVVVRPPATQGDVMGAVEAGATLIGLIDGGFEYTAPVWHKEILYGLSRGVNILGAASMGALRAAECHTYGMIGIGRIFEEYRDGTVIDDADVALIHAPAELNYFPLTVPMVNVRATLLQAGLDGVLTSEEGNALEQSAREMFFKERTWALIVENCQAFAAPRKLELGRLLPVAQIDQKRRDALTLAECLRTSDPLPKCAGDWTVQTTSFWREKFGLAQE
jgi:hypothetical protein